MRITLVILGIFLVVLVGACSGTTQTGNPYTLKLDREVRATVGADLRTTHVTARSMLEDEFLYLILHDALDAREGIIEARTAKDRLVRIETYALDVNQSAVEIFVSPMGDYQRAVDILNQLEQRLPYSMN